MKPINFKESTSILAKDQPEYLDLPIYKDTNGDVVSCWRLTIGERIKLLFTGRLWLSILTFNQRLQPQLPSVKKPIGRQGDNNT